MSTLFFFYLNLKKNFKVLFSNIYFRTKVYSIVNDLSREKENRKTRSSDELRDEIIIGLFDYLLTRIRGWNEDKNEISLIDLEKA